MTVFDTAKQMSWFYALKGTLYKLQYCFGSVDPILLLVHQKEDFSFFIPIWVKCVATDKLPIVGYVCVLIVFSFSFILQNML